MHYYDSKKWTEEGKKEIMTSEEVSEFNSRYQSSAWIIAERIDYIEAEHICYFVLDEDHTLQELYGIYYKKSQFSLDELISRVRTPGIRDIQGRLAMIWALKYGKRFPGLK